MDEVHNQEFQIRDLGTRSVTFFPNCAQVTRDIKTQLKPGTSEVTIVGLSPSVIERSIKVNSIGAEVIITDVVAESQDNCDKFDEIHPDTDSRDECDLGHGHDRNRADVLFPELKETQEQIAKLREKQDNAKEAIANAHERLESLYPLQNLEYDDAQVTKEADQHEHIWDMLNRYEKERENLNETIAAMSSQQRTIQQQMDDLLKRRDKLHELATISKVYSSMRKAEENKAHKRKEILLEDARYRRDREYFWARRVYVVKVSLETTGLTLSQPQQGSGLTSELATPAAETTTQVHREDLTTCDLVLTYFTSYAYWSPTYDLILSTATNSGILYFNARLTNKTSETWSNCKVILSTSQAVFSDLNHKIPTLPIWCIDPESYDCDTAVMIRRRFNYLDEELTWRRDYDEEQNILGGTSNTHKELFGTKTLGNLDLSAISQQVGHRQALSAVPTDGSKTISASTPDGEDRQAVEKHSQLEFHEASFEKAGLGSTYELAELKLLAPSSTTSKQRVSRVVFKSVNLSHIIVPKYKPIAYMKAEVLNDSTLSLIKGPVGLTLDGTFLGRAELPVCSPGATITLGLGVDPAIRVAYPEPKIKHFTLRQPSRVEYKKTCARSIHIRNLRDGDEDKPVTITVLDNIPTSENEDIGFHLVKPDGLEPGGPRVPAGDFLDHRDHEKRVVGAWATLKERGEIVWDVKLHAGEGMKLDLEYLCTFRLD
ncbi:hypothetical protein G7054_g11074 [Neopestalotiopsis clavispora]|nr:hypothetical protein G7054_g11074 [Neopestalotiopsis clavispora]